jgi:hypothetical protein
VQDGIEPLPQHTSVNPTRCKSLWRRRLLAFCFNGSQPTSHCAMWGNLQARFWRQGIYTFIPAIDKADNWGWATAAEMSAVEMQIHRADTCSEHWLYPRVTTDFCSVTTRAVSPDAP